MLATQVSNPNLNISFLLTASLFYTDAFSWILDVKINAHLRLQNLYTRSRPT